MKATYFLQATRTEEQTEADCTLCERRGGGHGPDRVAVGNSIFSASTSNNSQFAAPGHKHHSLRTKPVSLFHFGIFICWLIRTS